MPLKPPSHLKTALLVVDVQIGLDVSLSPFYGHTRSTPKFESTLTHLLSSIRTYNSSCPSTTHQISIIHINHNSTNPSSPLYPSKPTNAPMPFAAPLDGEPVIKKHVNGAFTGTNLEEMLRRQGVRQLLVCGIATDHCVSTTVRSAADLEIVKRDGEDEDGEGVVAIIEDACAAFDNGGRFDAETVHAVNVDSLRDEFADVVRVSDVVEVLR